MKDGSSKNIIETFEKWFAKAPTLPVNIRETLFKYMPLIALVFGILGILVSLGGLGALTVFSPLAVIGGVSGITSFGTGIISILFLLGAGVLMLVAYPGLKAKKINGWNMLFWSEMVYLVGAVLSLSVVSGIIGAIIGLYLLFQIKSYYK